MAVQQSSCPTYFVTHRRETIVAVAHDARLWGWPTDRGDSRDGRGRAGEERERERGKKKNVCVHSLTRERPCAVGRGTERDPPLSGPMHTVPARTHGLRVITTRSAHTVEERHNGDALVYALLTLYTAQLDAHLQPFNFASINFQSPIRKVDELFSLYWLYTEIDAITQRQLCAPLFSLLNKTR